MLFQDFLRSFIAMYSLCVALSVAHTYTFKLIILVHFKILLFVNAKVKSKTQ